MDKYAVLVTAGPDDAGSAVNGLEYALSLADGGHDVTVFLDGEATKWPETVSTQVEHPVRDSLEELRESNLLDGACAYCASVFDATDGCREAGITLHGTAGEEHAPDVGELASNGYELVTVN